MTDTRAQLLTRKDDLLTALQLLERDHEDGVVDEDAYRVARRRYEEEAAGVLERLDAMQSDDVSSGAASGRGRRRRTLIAGASLLIVGAIALALVAAVHARSGTQAITGDAGVAAATPTTASQIRAAEEAVRSQPRSVVALVALGNAYLSAGRVADADRAYQRGMRLDPTAPQPPVLHAMILGYSGRIAPALSLLHRVEKEHPTFPRPWVLDGVFSARRDPAHAIAAWRRFLQLDPHSSLAGTVRGWITDASRKHRSSS